MKKYVPIFVMAFVTISCIKKTDQILPMKVSALDTLVLRNVDFHTIPLDSFRQFQTFDESKMEGFGEVEKHPFVYVKKMDRYTIVRRSDNLDSLIIYQKAGEYWVNYHWENFDRVDSLVCKCGNDRYATKYTRVLFNDTILELRQTYINGETLDDLIINDHKKIVVLHLMDDIADIDAPFADIIKIAHFYNVHKSLELYNKRYLGIKRYVREYTIYEDSECLRFCCWEKDNERELKYELTPLHYYNIYPDF